MQAIAKPETRTRDLGGPLGTKAFGEQVAAVIAAGLESSTPPIRLLGSPWQQ